MLSQSVINALEKILKCKPKYVCLVEKHVFFQVGDKQDKSDFEFNRDNQQFFFILGEEAFYFVD